VNIYKTIPAVMDGYRKLGVEVRRFPLFIRATEIERHNRAVQRMRDNLIADQGYVAKTMRWEVRPTEASTATEKP